MAKKHWNPETTPIGSEPYLGEKLHREWRRLRRMLRDYKEERQYLSTKSFQGERRPMALCGEGRGGHVTAVGGVVTCPVLADSVTLPAISAKRKDTMLRHAGAEQQHIDDSCNKSPQRKGQGKCR